MFVLARVFLITIMGSFVGSRDGTTLGELVGIRVGFDVRVALGEELGLDVGALVIEFIWDGVVTVTVFMALLFIPPGFDVGSSVSPLVGSTVEGDVDGVKLGSRVGVGDGSGVQLSSRRSIHVWVLVPVLGWTLSTQSSGCFSANPPERPPLDQFGPFQSSGCLMAIPRLNTCK